MVRLLDGVSHLPIDRSPFVGRYPNRSGRWPLRLRVGGSFTIVVIRAVVGEFEVKVAAGADLLMGLVGVLSGDIDGPWTVLNV
jgi:hypothetical protein